MRRSRENQWPAHLRCHAIGIGIGIGTIVPARKQSSRPFFGRVSDTELIGKIDEVARVQGVCRVRADILELIGAKLRRPLDIR